jgi:signal transduction histidine kinase
MKTTTKASQTNVPVSDWIETESIKKIKQSVKKTSVSSFIGIVVLLALLYPHTKHYLLWLWAIMHGFILVGRAIYFSRGQNNIIVNKYYKLVVTFAGLIWGSTIFLLFNEEQSRVEAIALCVIIIYGIVSIINLSQHLRSAKLFLVGYGAGIIGSIFGHIIFLNEKILTAVDAMSLILTILFLYILYQFAKQLNSAHINNLHLQYNNNTLIESLMVEKQAALNAVEVKNRFLAGATHDMRQPVLALDLYTDMLISTPDALPTILPKISLATKSVISLFDALFDLARMSMNQLKPEKLRFNINDMIVDLSQQFEPIAAAKGLGLRVRQGQQRIEIFDDPVLIRRVISNLLSNSIKYTDHGGILLVCRNNELRGIRLEVWDTGVGISPDMQKAVFSEFYKNPENVGTSDGFGLGLSIVSQMCTLLGHKVFMKSRRGRGTVVSVRLADSVHLH